MLPDQEGRMAMRRLADALLRVPGVAADALVPRPRRATDGEVGKSGDGAWAAQPWSHGESRRRGRRPYLGYPVPASRQRPRPSSKALPRGAVQEGLKAHREAGPHMSTSRVRIAPHFRYMCLFDDPYRLQCMGDVVIEPTLMYRYPLLRFGEQHHPIGTLTHIYR